MVPEGPGELGTQQRVPPPWLLPSKPAEKWPQDETDGQPSSACGPDAGCPLLCDWWGRESPPPRAAWEPCAPFPLSPRPILRALSVSADALTADVRVKGRWNAGVLKGREKSGGRKKRGGGTESGEREKQD